MLLRPPAGFDIAAVSWAPVWIGMGAVAIALVVVIIVGYVSFRRELKRGGN